MSCMSLGRSTDKREIISPSRRRQKVGGAKHKKSLKQRRDSRTSCSLLSRYRVGLRVCVVRGITCKLSTICWTTGPARHGRSRALSVQRELSELRGRSIRRVGPAALPFTRIVGPRITVILCYLLCRRTTEVGA
jgi:hypothetical protein